MNDCELDVGPGKKHASSRFDGLLKLSQKCRFPAMSARLGSFDGGGNTKMKIVSPKPQLRAVKDFGGLGTSALLEMLATELPTLARIFYSVAKLKIQHQGIINERC